ncbi:MAG: CoA transferase [Bacteroidia bacterium]|nr:CoA transferase [Bacteroidia bacterium]
MSKQVTILSLEQALALPYATQRLVQQGYRVIRIETPQEGSENAGDPNRYIGADLGYRDARSYYVAPNVGKEAITLNLRTPEGRALLLTLISELKVDVFMCNTLPRRYKQLGIDFETLRSANKDLIWCGISAMGPEYPDRAGYDPALQALLGFTYLTGESNGTPVPCGIPVIDLKAGDEAFTQVVLAMLGKANGKSGSGTNGKQIHISMAQCAASWLITALPQLNFVKSDDELFKRSGNEHRSFIPCNAYPTSDGFVYLAIGNDIQWQRLVSAKGFESLASETRTTNAGRLKEKETIYKEIGQISRQHTTQSFYELCLSMDLSVSPINSVREVSALEFVKKTSVKTHLPDGKEAVLSPPSYTTEFLSASDFTLSFPPRLGENTRAVLKESGLTDTAIQTLFDKKVV